MSYYALIIVPIFLLLIGAEVFFSKRKEQKNYRLNDTISNLNIGIGSRIVGLFSKFLLLGAFMFVYEKFALLNIPFSWWSVLILLFFYDFLFYWAHRLGHESNLFWGAHLVHHQSEEYNFSVALRQSWFHDLLAFFIFLPIPILGFDILTFGVASLVNSLFQFWIHTKTIKKMPSWFEFIFNTPSHHRVHHAINPQYLDKNHAGMFIIWDRLFRTYAEEEEAPSYGITKQLNSWNPLWANFHYYQEMFFVSKSIKGWKHKLKLLFAKPGWLPKEMREYQYASEPESNRQKYDLKASKPLMRYVLAQFILVLGGTVAFMYHFESLSLFFKILCAVAIVFSILISGAIMEGKSWAKYAEFIRLIMIFVGLNSLYYVWYIDWFLITLIFTIIGLITFSLWFALRLNEFKPSKVFQ